MQKLMKQAEEKAEAEKTSEDNGDTHKDVEGAEGGDTVSKPAEEDAGGREEVEKIEGGRVRKQSEGQDSVDGGKERKRSTGIKKRKGSVPKTEQSVK